MEAKQHTPEKPIDHRINQKGNKNVHRNKQKLKHNPKSMGFSKIRAKREIHGNASLSQETRQTSNKQHKFTPKATRKARTEEPQSY